MKRIASFLALILFSAFTFAAVNITVNPNNVDFGEVSIKGKRYVQGETTLHVAWENMPLWSQVYIAVKAQPAANCAFKVDGGYDTTYIWTGSGDTYDPIIYSYDCPITYYADHAGDYSCQIIVYAEDPDYTRVAEKTINVTLKVTNDAVVPKTIPFERVNSLSELKNNDTIVFVSESAKAINGTYDGSTAHMDTLKTNVTIDAANGKAEIPETALMFKATQYSGNWQFWTVAATSKRLNLDIVSNNAKGAFTFSDPVASQIFASWGVTISSGVAVVSRADDDQTYPIRFNGDRFKPYKSASTGTDIAIYKKVGKAAEITSKLEIGAIDFGTVELDEVKEVVVNYTGENLTANIMWDITGTDKALFSVSPDESTDRTSGSVTVKYLGTALAVKTIDAKLYALTQDAASDDLEKEVPISITLVKNTIKLTKIEFVGAPDSLVKGTSIDLKPYLKLTPDNAADKSLTWTVDNSYQGTVEDGVYTAKNLTGNVTITATSVKVPSVSASITLMQYEPKPKTVTLNKHELTTYIGVNDTLQATVSPVGASQKCWYTSRNTNIITCKKGNVDGAGVLTVKALCPEGVWVIVNPGSSATEYPNIKDSCLVKVVPVSVESVAFDPDTKEMTVGAIYQLVPVVTPAAAATQYTATYESNNTAVATVDADGKVTAVAEGTAEITCTLGGKSGKITINVVGAKFFTKVTDASTLRAKDTIILAVAGGAGTDAYAIVAGARNTDKKALSVVKEGVTITADAAAADQALQFVLGEATGGFTLTPVGTSTAIAIGTSNDIVDATASNNKVWEFLADGTNGIYVHNIGTNTNGYGYLRYHISNNVIKAYKTTTTGAVYVYVYVRPYTEPVKPAATGISLDQTSYDTHVGDKDITLKATVTPADADQAVIWESSNKDVATVNASGQVHPVSAGTAVITAKVKSNESLKAECTVNVLAWTVEYVEFDITGDLNLEVGEQETVTATAYPTGHGFKVDYYTSDENVATVTIGGVVTAVAEGDAVITAKSGDKEATLNIHVTAAAVPEDKGAISVADFLAAKDGFNIYTLTGVVANITNTKYGNFDLIDETGKIYIYGLLNAAGEAQKFAELNVAEKDTVTLKGSYSEFNNKAQIKDALFVSVKKYVEPVGPSTAIDAVMKQGQATKVLRQGQLIIIRDDKEYNAVGKRVK